MEFMHNYTNATLARDVNIMGGLVLPHSYSRTGKKYRVEGAHVTYTLGRNGAGWKVQRVALRGPVLRKDGSDGKETFSGEPGYRWETRPEYAWLVELTEAIRPEGIPVLPFRLTGLENDDLEAGE